MENRSKLPFIHLPTLDLKILIDSGASDSIINPGPAFQKFYNYVYKKPFIVSSVHGKITSNNNIKFPILQEIGIHQNINMHVIDWHKKFDALLGSSDLLKLGANINYTRNTLKLNKIEIPFYLEHTSKLIPTENVNLNNYIKIPVTIENGEILFPETKLNKDYIIPECISKATNGYCVFPSQNNSL